MKKSKGRYGKASEKKIKGRKYTSYEDAPLKQINDSEPVPQHLTVKFFKVFLILFLSVVVVLALINLDKLTPDNISHWFQYELLGKTEGNGYPVRFNGVTVETGNFSTVDRVPIYCSDTSLVVLNSNAGEFQDTQHAFASPVLNTNRNYSIIYNANATGYRIVNRDSTIYTGNAENKIFDADISPNGTYIILNHGSDYLSECTVYKRDNTKKYEYLFADYYMNNITIDQYGSRAAASGVSAHNGSIISVVYILDFNQNNYLQKYEFDDSYIYDIKYLDNGNVFAVGSSAAYLINVDEGNKTEIGYNMRTLSCYSICRDYGALISLSANDDGRNGDIIAVNNSGKTDTSISLEDRALSLDYRDGRIAVLNQGSASIYNTNGLKIANITTSSDSRKACFGDSNCLYLLGTSMISKSEVKYEE